MNIDTVAIPELLPHRQHHDDAGADLHSVDMHFLAPGERKLVNTGVSVAIPDGHVGLVCPRSGLAHKEGVTVLNAPGIVDAGYRGDIKVNLINHGEETVMIASGERIAQLVMVPFVAAVYTPVQTLPDSERGTGGHGSTGKA